MTIRKLEEFAEKVRKEMNALYESDSFHCDTWAAGNFKESDNRKFVAYLKTRFYEDYYNQEDEEYNGIVVAELGGDSERFTGMKPYIYRESYLEEDHIDSILDISNEGKVKYKTKDGLEHLF